jgi:hypothetical protein
MKAKIRNGVVLSMILLAGFITWNVQAQAANGNANGKGLEWWVYQDVVLDSKQAQYEEARKEIIALLHKDRISSTEFQVLALKSDGQACVVYSAPASNGGQSRDAASLSVDWGEVFADLGPAYLNAWNRMRDATRISSEFLIRFRPDLSFVPTNPRFRPDEQLFIRSDYYYTSPKGKAAFERVLKRLRQLQQTKGLETGYRVFEIVLGPEKPGYLVTTGARSQEELQAALDSDAAALGTAGANLLNQARNLAGKVERHNDRLRMDLSYFPTP